MTGISIDAAIAEILADNALRRRLGRLTPGIITTDNREALATGLRATLARVTALTAPYARIVSDDGEIMTTETPEAMTDAERSLAARLITHAAGRRMLADIYAGIDTDMAGAYTASAEASESTLMAIMARAAAGSAAKAPSIKGRLY